MHVHTYRYMYLTVRQAKTAPGSVGEGRADQPRGHVGLMWERGWLGPNMRGQYYFSSYGGFLKWGYPQAIHFNGIFYHKPSILGYLCSF